ncbi:hypothetical protein PANT_9c00320 [Moesziomyces antarcticus T-34]|uniref:Uncharacterized protein n=1 Tax=Pseudozyma antarctica (strain T-34) TaxID=1151754 RepID=M9M1D3_PSEA3|nr:hypothetical protein PANT_9c00320 [Moesziomyces antarcticus T-34]
MSRRDVDLEFEQAYQRLFSTSSSSVAVQPGKSTSSVKGDARPQSSQKPHRSHLTKEVGEAARPSGHARHHVLALASQRKVSAAKTHPAVKDQAQARPHAANREQVASSASRSEHAPQPSASAAAKGKGRARPYTTEKHRHAVPHVPASIPTTASTPYGAYAPPVSMAYYPYTQSHAPFHVSAPVVAPGVTALPNPTVAWTQPMMPPGPVPAIAYPSFSASVTFSQPQFFASQPHPIPAGMMPPPSESWSSADATGSTQPPRASGSKTAGPVAAQDHGTSALHSKHKYPKRHRASVPAELQPPLLKSRASGQLTSILRLPAKIAAVKKETLKPELDDSKTPIPKRRGRPPSRTKATLQSGTVLAPAEPKSRSHSPAPPKATVMPAKFDGCLPLREHAGVPQNRETHTLFIHASRRLSQADPAGLFPRHRRREYVALRKQSHAATRTAVLRICIRRLRRYLALTAAKARTAPQAHRTTYLNRKLRAAKLGRHLHRALRPAALDARRLWSNWARTRSIAGSSTARVKLEHDDAPEVVAEVKMEPSDGVATLPLDDVHAAPVRTHAPLFLRRNFNLYRLLGIRALPLA